MTELPLVRVYTPRGKADLIIHYAKVFGLDIFVETGTYQGTTVEAVKYNFRKIFSIELGPEHAASARERFKHWGHINIIRGDSGEFLAPLLLFISEPVLIYLDAHYSGGDTYCTPWETTKLVTPVMQEMDSIIRMYEAGYLDPRTVIIVDDIGDFKPVKHHPPLNEFLEKVSRGLPDHDISFSYDMLRITPKQGEVDG